jgi:hypothetical protein
LAETLSYNSNLRLIQRRKQGFLDKIIFNSKRQGQIIGVIIMNLGIFGENFRIFGQVELLK